MTGENQNIPTFHSGPGIPVPQPPTPQIYDWQNVTTPGQHVDPDAFNLSAPQPPMPQEGGQVSAIEDTSIDHFGHPLPMPPTPTEEDWQIEAARKNGVPPPPPPEDQNQNQDHNHKPYPDHGTVTNTKPSPPSISGQTCDLYNNVTLADFPVAGQVKHGKLVKNSEFVARTEMKEDGVQHAVSTDWQHQGESGGNSHKQEWFEARGA